MNFSVRTVIRLPSRVRSAALAAGLVFGASAFIAGCGGDSAAATHPTVTPAAAPVISSQPTNQSVPMGLPATYAVTATGSDLQFQWKKNGVAIAGATGSSYTTPATAFADSGASFSVTVGNSTAAVDSTAATLTVGARAPMAGDLRFQQVDAASTGHGWGSTPGVATNLLARAAINYSQGIGTPFYVGGTGNCTAPATADGVGCTWFYSENPGAASPGNASLSTSYASDTYANLQADLQSSAWPGFQDAALSLTPVSGSSVITSLDLEPASVLFAVAWTQSTQASGFHSDLARVTPADLQAAAVQEGGLGRVITALSYDNGQVTYLAYGWQADAGTVYETQIVTSSPANAPAAAAGLAAQGYIITASGRADDDGNLLLVGTRVQGDSMARPLASAQGEAVAPLMQQGYAIVAVISDLSQAKPITFILER